MKAQYEAVDALFAEWDKPGSPGCAVAVMQGGEIIYKRGYGQAHLEYDVPITPATIFHAASISKQFTAMAVVLLAEDGKLSLDDDIRKYVPEMHDFGEAITIRHLVHHTSGLRDQWELLVLAGWRMDDVIKTADVMDLAVRQRELSFRPGEDHLYCNTGYTLMGVIVERVSGQTLAEFCAARLFGPLGMDSTHFHDDHTRPVRNRAYSYRPGEHGFANAVLSYATAGATSLFTTVEDLARWDENFYTGGTGGKRVIAQMHERGVLNNGEVLPYAFGLGVGKYKGLDVAGHSGADAGFRAHLLRVPAHHFSVALLGNHGGMDTAGLARKVVDVFLAEYLEDAAEDLPEVITLDEAQLADRAGLYYSAGKGVCNRLEVVDGKLTIMEGPGYELEPLAADHFREAASPQIHWRFGVREVTITDGANRPGTYQKVVQAHPAAEELQACAGVYESPELGIAWEIFAEGDALVLKRRKYGESRLRPLFKDAFEGDLLPGSGEDGGLVVRFERGAGGKAAGVLVSSWRIRDLRFERR